MKKAPAKPADRVYGRGQNPASIATRIGPGGKLPRKRVGPKPPEDPEVLPSMLRNMLWVMAREEHWDTPERQSLRKLMNEDPTAFSKILRQLREEWDREKHKHIGRADSRPPRPLQPGIR